jgi:hypothetical protein
VETIAPGGWAVHCCGLKEIAVPASIEMMCAFCSYDCNSLDWVTNNPFAQITFPKTLAFISRSALGRTRSESVSFSGLSSQSHVNE